MSAPLNTLFCNLPSFHKHCSNEKPFRASLTGFCVKTNRATPLRIVVRVSDDNCCKPQNALGRNHNQLLSRSNRGLHFFSQDVCSPSIFLGPHSLPSQVIRFALASSSLTIPSTRSTIGLKYEKIEGCEQSKAWPSKSTALGAASNN